MKKRKHVKLFKVVVGKIYFRKYELKPCNGSLEEFLQLVWRSYAKA